jgi:hypothetical protein
VDRDASEPSGAISRMEKLLWLLRGSIKQLADVFVNGITAVEKGYRRLPPDAEFLHFPSDVLVIRVVS